MKSSQRLASALLGLVVAACASDPPVLVSLSGPPAVAERRPHAGTGGTVMLRRVTLPGYLDNHAVVVGRRGNTLIVSADAEWAERPRDAVTRVLGDALAQRMGASSVLLRGERRIADAELVVEFVRLDPSNGVLQLDARWSFVCATPERRVHAGRTELQVYLDAESAPAVAAATVDALTRLAEVLAGQAGCRGGNERGSESRR